MQPVTNAKSNAYSIIFWVKIWNIILKKTNIWSKHDNPYVFLQCTEVYGIFFPSQWLHKRLIFHIKDSDRDKPPPPSWALEHKCTAFREKSSPKECNYHVRAFLNKSSYQGFSLLIFLMHFWDENRTKSLMGKPTLNPHR